VGVGAEQGNAIGIKNDAVSPPPSWRDRFPAAGALESVDLDEDLDSACCMSADALQRHVVVDGSIRSCSSEDSDDLDAGNISGYTRIGAFTPFRRSVTPLVTPSTAIASAPASQDHALRSR